MSAPVVVLQEIAVAPPVHVPARRPVLLSPLYLTFGALQVLDVHSTFAATGRGRKESNPLVRGIVGNPVQFIALKTIAGTGVVYLTEKTWRRNRVAAILTMVGLNAAYAAIVAHNYSLAR
jgi:hypothetical protein